MMKYSKILVLLLAGLFVCSVPAFAVDLSQGSIMITGDTNLNIGSQTIKYDSGGDHKISTFGFMVSGGYFVIDNIEVFGMFEFERETVKNGAEVTETTFKLGVGGNYYFDLKSELFPYAGGFLGYMSTKEENGYDSEVKGTQFGVHGGAKYFLNDFVAIDGGAEFSIGMGTAKSGGYEDDVDVNEFKLYGGVAVLI